MKKLILMRHAKSTWDDPMMTDRERPLNGRGRRSADALGDWLRSQNHIPDQALISDAMRTRETFERLGIKCETSFMGALYLAPAAVMMNILKEAKGDTVLIVGHNPGIAEFAEQIVDQPPDHERFLDYPTGATLIAEFDIGAWSDLHVNAGRTTGFVVPRALTD